MRKRLFALPFVFIFGLTALAFLPAVRQNTKLFWTFVGAAAILSAWTLILASRHSPQLEISLRKQHYLQACAQGSVLLCWGWYWPPVYDSAHLILAQLLFSYAFDMLLSWSRGKAYTLGFGPFPVIFSINLFLWFKPDWFYLQFAMVALGFLAKEFLRWNREGRSVHIFNPSSFPLAVVSLGLLWTGASDLTWGREIATTQFYPPHMYLVLFLIGLPGQYFFGVTLMTMSAVVTTYLFGLAYFGLTGIYFFYDSYIPIAVFLGMHLLFTDPSTSPKTDAGRVIFGVLYGLSTVALYQLLGSAGLPTFYDKLLQVPLLNLSVTGIDRIVRSGQTLTPHKRHLAFMAIWAAVFAGMSTAQGVGDDHPGQWLPFWRQACQEGRPYACPYLADLQVSYCRRGSSWSCNEAGLLHIALSQSGEDLRRLDLRGALNHLERGCELGSTVACGNIRTLTKREGEFTTEKPLLEDLPIILRGSKGPLPPMEPTALYALACRQGWTDACGANGPGSSTPPDAR